MPLFVLVNIKDFKKLTSTSSSLFRKLPHNAWILSAKRLPHSANSDFCSSCALAATIKAIKTHKTFILVNETNTMWEWRRWKLSFYLAIDWLYSYPESNRYSPIGLSQQIPVSIPSTRVFWWNLCVVFGIALVSIGFGTFKKSHLTMRLSFLKQANICTRKACT